MADLSTFNKKDEHEEENLRGTFFLVFFIGGFILLTWLAVLYIYLSRLQT
ncbi:MAG: cytochrome c oxidase subunit 2A [Bacillaceae bacterium]|nr:cytochrome c oxidase subunit 2A [Bacillaceae bacterium]